MSALVASEIFRLFVNTLTSDEKVFPSLYADFLTTTSNAFISKRNLFFSIFYCILKYARNLEHSEKKEEYPSLIITEIISSERDVYLSV